MFRTPALMAAAVLALFAAGCGRPGGGSGKVLNLYTARHYDADLKLYAAFEAKSGVHVRWLEMDPAQLVERMKAEGASSPADVILMADAGALWRAQQANLFQPVTTPTLESRIPAALHEPTGLWVGLLPPRPGDRL